MISPSLAVLRAIGDRLTADPTVTALVADRVVSISRLPEGPFPVVLLGDDQEVAADVVARRYVTVHSTLHIWTDEPGMTTAKEIGSAIFGAVRCGLPAIPGTRFHDVRFEGARYMRDPAGRLAHGIVNVRTLVEVLS